MQTIEYLMQPQGTMLQAYSDCRSRVQLIRGPLGSGKTIQSCMKILDLMCEQKPNREGKRLSRWVAVRNTYPDLFNTTIKDWLECHGNLGRFKGGGMEPPHQDISIELKDGTWLASEIIFVSFDRPEHVKKARGLQLTGVWLNEAKELSKAVVDMLDLRHGRYPSKKDGVVCSWHGMIGDYNAPDEDHWLYRLAEEDKPASWKFFNQPGGVMLDADGGWIVNPNAENIHNLPENYYLTGMQGKGEDWIKVNLGNEYGFVATGKPVHPRYVDSVHCQDIPFELSNSKDIVLGFDFGRTPACAMIQQTATGGWVCFDEFLSEDMSALSFAPELAKYLSLNYAGHTYRGWGDPSGDSKGQATNDTPIKILNATGIPCRATNTNDPIIRRASVELPLRDVGMDGRPRLIILPKAKIIRKGLAGGFCYKRIQVSGDEKYKDEPDKNKFSHPVEALEYALQGEGEGREVLQSAEGKSVYDDWSVALNV